MLQFHLEEAALGVDALWERSAYLGSVGRDCERLLGDELPFGGQRLGAVDLHRDVRPARHGVQRGDDRIEVIPLAYMRGRTLNNAYIILDEAQNTTVSQMKMFLTRMGEGSRIAVCGDTTQVDLPSHKKSGLADALVRLRSIGEVGQIALTGDDIVRHDLVQKVVNAYEEPEEGSQRAR